MTFRRVSICLLILACCSFALAQVDQGVDPKRENDALDTLVSLGGRVGLHDLLKLMQDHKVAYLVPDMEAMQETFVTISADNVPLRDLMNAFATVYDFTWIQEGSIYVLKLAHAMHPGGMPPGLPGSDFPMPTVTAMPSPMPPSGIVMPDTGPPADIAIQAALPKANVNQVAPRTSPGNALGQTLTRDQWAVLKSRGFLKTSDLSARQRRLIHVQRGGRVKFQYNGKMIVIHANVQAK